MNKELFKKEMLTALRTRGFDGVNIQAKHKVNVSRECFVLTKRGDVTSPVISVDEMYERFQKGESLADLADFCLKAGITLDNCLNPTKIIPQLINEDKNIEYLKSVVHRKMNGLALIYRAVVNENDCGVHSYVITSQILKDLNMTEKDLFRKAVIENSDYTIKGLVETMAEIADIPVELFADAENDLITVISNDAKTYGAAMVLNPTVKALLSEKYPDGYYLLPSSIHEMLAAPKDMMSVDEFKEMVRDVNCNEVADEDLLSDEVYKPCNEGIELAV